MRGHYADAPRWAKVALGVAAILVVLVLAYSIPSVVGVLYSLWGM